MTIKLSYRIETCEHDVSPDQENFPIYLESHLVAARTETGVRECAGGRLVPDSRLHAITAAWSDWLNAGRQMDGGHHAWWELKRAMEDALTGENNDITQQIAVDVVLGPPWAGEYNK